MKFNEFRSLVFQTRFDELINVSLNSIAFQLELFQPKFQQRQMQKPKSQLRVCTILL